MIQSDATTFDLGQTRLRLKSGLAFAVRQGTRETWYQIEDESRSQFFRIGPAEYTFLSMLDGETTMATALAQTCSVMGAKAFSEDDAIGLCKWLVEVELAHTDATTASVRLAERQKDREKSQAIQKINPISIRFPLLELDSIAASLSTYFGWLISWRFAVVWCATVVIGLVSLLISWETSASTEVFSRDNWVWFTVTWIVLKIIHESAHVLACKKFGGKVGKGGILFLLMIPMPYVDVTSAWGFTSKHARILVSAAGMMAEIFLAAIAAIVWSQTGPGSLHFHAANVMVAASLHTLLFNANPLMRFDGYHILADWLEMPNLGNHGQQYVNGLGRKWFYGLPSQELQYSGFHGQIVKAYGIGALLWKVLICVGLCIGALNLFPGFGLLIAAVGVVLWLGLPSYQLIKFVVLGSEFETPNRKQFAMMTTGLLLAFLAVGKFAPAPSVINAPVVIDFKDSTSVRPETAGFVREILVADQQFVQAGDLLMVLENRELEARQAKFKFELAKAKLRARSLQKERKIGALQAEQAVIESLRKQLQDIEHEIQCLNVTAPHSGQVVARKIDDLLGNYVEAGRELLSIGEQGSKEAVALITQQDAKFLAKQMGCDSTLRIWGVPGLRKAKLSDVKPRVVDDLPHFAFAGVYGGPVDVVRRSEVERKGSLLQPGDLMMVSARVPVHLELSLDLSNELKSGQSGLVHFRGRHQNLGSYLIDRSIAWLQNNINHYHGL